MIEHLKKFWFTHSAWLAWAVHFAVPSVNVWTDAHPKSAMAAILSVVLMQLYSSAPTPSTGNNRGCCSLRPILTIALTLTLAFCIPIPARAAVKDHALYRFGKHLLQINTYKDVLAYAAKGLEAGVDVVHAGTYAVNEAVAKADAGLEKIESVLTGN
jgi:hypothetical protein